MLNPSETPSGLPQNSGRSLVLAKLQQEYPRIVQELEALETRACSRGAERNYVKGLLIGAYCSEDQNTNSESINDARKLLHSLELDPKEVRPGFHQFCKGLGVNSRSLKRAAPRLMALAETQKDRLGIANSIIRSLLCGVANELGDAEIKQRFLSKNISEKELLEVLAYSASESRTNCVRAMLYLATLYPDVQGFVVAKLNNMLHFVGTPERISILSEIIQREKDPNAAVQVQQMLLGSFDLKQLKDVVAGAGERKLLAIGRPEVKELLAYAAILPLTRQVKIPARLASTSTRADVKEQWAKLQESINKIGEICLEQEHYRASPLAKRLLKIANLHLTEIKCLSEESSTLAEQIKACNCLRAKCGLEFLYGIQLANERHTPAGDYRRWEEKEIQEIKEVLERIPEGRVLFTPKLNSIQRVKSLGQHVLGQRFDNGIIRIADEAINHPYVKKAYQGHSSLQITLTHELGHSVQLGAVGAGLEEKGDSFVFIPGEPAYNFDEFMNLSGWSLIGEKRYKIENHGLSVVLDGEHLPLGLPTKLRGEYIMLVYNQGLLLSYRLDGQFSLIDYSRSNPWEDWAEGFCEYVMLPERLILFAPQKFLYFEQEFRKYAADKSLLRQLQEMLSRKEADGGDRAMAA